MTGANGINFEGPDFLDGFQHKFTVRLQNYIEIVIKRFVVFINQIVVASVASNDLLQTCTDDIIDRDERHHIVV